VGRAIREMRVRGAPAIGVAAGYGLALAALRSRARSAAALRADLCRAGTRLVAARPTAVNLAWAVKRLLAVAAESAADAAGVRARVLADARAIEREDLAANLRMGKLGAALFPRRINILTHCNTGALATAGHGTALGVIRTAYARGKIRQVFVDETRPYLQGARLTAWELKADCIPFTLITDNMAAHFMGRGEVGAVIVGADRITRRGDVANKIGTYGLAVLARAHRIPFYVAAPTSTLDLSLRHGRDIVIEERSVDEVVRIAGHRIAPPGIRAAHPAFDVTPGRLVTAIITEAGVARPPYLRSLPRLLR
jgi:methylthioribose-1-phosphate isomerase